MNFETSNLLDYDLTQLSLLIECIDDKIKEEKMLVEQRFNLIEKCEDMSECLEIELRHQISNKHDRLADLYGLRVAIMNAHQVVIRREKMISN